MLEEDLFEYLLVNEQVDEREKEEDDDEDLEIDIMKEL